MDSIKKDPKEAMPRFETVRTVRFELKPSADTLEKLKAVLPRGDFQVDIEKFITGLRKFYSGLADIIIDKSEEGFALRRGIEIKYGWLRSYTKNDFYTFIEGGDGRLPIKYGISDVGYLKRELQRWFVEWKEIILELEGMIQAPLESQRRRRDFAQLIRGLKKRQNFEFIREFSKALCNTNDPATDHLIEDLRISINSLEGELQEVEAAFASSQSAGFQIARGSFNYYTINKDPKSLKTEEKEERDKLNRSLSSFKDKFGSQEFFLSGKFSFIDAATGEGRKEDSASWTLEESYGKLKEWKSGQKKKFLEAIQAKIITVGNFSSKFPLFESSKEDFLAFLDLSERMAEANKKKSREENEGRKKEIDKGIKQLAQQRGEFFNKPGKRVQTRKYYDICQIFKNIAFKRGGIVARISGIGNERRESQSLQYWALIMEEQKKHFLIMIPRGESENYKKARESIEKRLAERGEIKIYHFKSLTLRALEKLCFKEIGNTFAPELKKQGVRFPRYKQEWGGQEERMVKFYQEVLTSSYAHNLLDIAEFGDLQSLLKKEYKSLVDFRSDLEKAAYLKKEIYLADDEKESFLRNYDALVFEIDSYDLRIESENRPENKGHQDKAHTRLWKDFWTSQNKEIGYGTRLNPEVKVFWREADEELSKSLSSGKISQPRKLDYFRNRYSRNHFNLAITITSNAIERKNDLAFKSISDIEKYIQNFNDDFNKNFKGEWFYGIDRGLKQLATLCIMRFSKQSYPINGKSLSCPEFSRIEAWQLKDENYSEDVKREDGTQFRRSAIKNLSYFLDKAELFEKKMVSCIDLTTAKMIKGKIVLNGDLMTYFKLKEHASRRKIFSLFSESKINDSSEIKISKSGSTIVIKDNCQEYQPIYWISQRQEKKTKGMYREIETPEQIIKKLDGYLKDIGRNNINEDIITVDKINHLRDAITANIVGVVSHLQGLFPGIIAFEDMDEEDHISKHFTQSNENISRRLEWAFYRNFQVKGLVPPQVKSTIFLRKEFKDKQFGIVQFVKMENTSCNCPRCGEKFPKTSDHRHYICGNPGCGFSSLGNRMEFSPLDDSDKVAAFNVAKNAFNKLYEI